MLFDGGTITACFVLKIILSCLDLFLFLFFRNWKTLRLGALPPQNLPKKSHENNIKSPELRHLNTVHDRTQEVKSTVVYKNEFLSRVSTLKLKLWILDKQESKVTFKYYSKPYLSPKFEVIIDDSLVITCALFGCVLPDTHEVYKQYKRSVRNIPLSGPLKEISNFKVCNGLAAYTSGTH